jgi:methylenetetrahydrofolate reductase (NADPH)
MSGRTQLPDDTEIRFEVLPLGRSEEEAAQLPEPVRLTVTCSPKLGPDRSVEVGGRLRGLGHAVTVHLAARMVRDEHHLDELLTAMSTGGIDDVFVIGGDADPPLGPFSAAGDVLSLIAHHPRRPATIGVGGYPEGHPAIDDETLDRVLREKSEIADYVATQLCFDVDALGDWIRRQRAGGMTLPVLVGMPGQVMAARLLEMSARIGVGPSVAFLRKQRGLKNLFGLFRRSASDRLLTELIPAVQDGELGIAGLHLFTFNQLLSTYRWQHERQAQRAGGRMLRESPGATLVSPEESQG